MNTMTGMQYISRGVETTTTMRGRHNAWDISHTVTIIKSDIIYDPSTKDEAKNSWEYYYIALDSQDYDDRSYTNERTHIIQKSTH